mmetsp:Transcript_10369/g.28157  ORF Transcript_10369/g.28157 Transcript_10369/m.28157 type:complete len:240 (+) Transcript_10369:474-1193(+)
MLTVGERLAHARLELLHGVAHEGEAEQRRNGLWRKRLTGRADVATLVEDMAVSPVVRNVRVEPAPIEHPIQHTPHARGASLHVVQKEEAVLERRDGVRPVRSALGPRRAPAPGPRHVVAARVRRQGRHVRLQQRSSLGWPALRPDLQCVVWQLLLPRSVRLGLCDARALVSEVQGPRVPVADVQARRSDHQRREEWTPAHQLRLGRRLGEHGRERIRGGGTRDGTVGQWICVSIACLWA